MTKKCYFLYANTTGTIKMKPVARTDLHLHDQAGQTHVMRTWQTPQFLDINADNICSISPVIEWNKYSLSFL